MTKRIVTRTLRNAAVFSTETEAQAALECFASRMLPRQERALEVVYVGSQGGFLVCADPTATDFGWTYFLSDAAVAEALRTTEELERPGGCGAARNCFVCAN